MGNKDFIEQYYYNKGFEDGYDQGVIHGLRKSTYDESEHVNKISMLETEVSKLRKQLETVQSV